MGFNSDFKGLRSLIFLSTLSRHFAIHHLVTLLVLDWEKNKPGTKKISSPQELNLSSDLFIFDLLLQQGK